MLMVVYSGSIEKLYFLTSMFNFCYVKHQSNLFSSNCQVNFVHFFLRKCLPNTAALVIRTCMFSCSFEEIMCSIWSMVHLLSLMIAQEPVIGVTIMKELQQVECLSCTAHSENDKETRLLCQDLRQLIIATFPQGHSWLKKKWLVPFLRELWLFWKLLTVSSVWGH